MRRRQLSGKCACKAQRTESDGSTMSHSSYDRLSMPANAELITTDQIEAETGMHEPVDSTKDCRQAVTSWGQ